MQSIYDVLRNNPKKWLVTGCAGFIGSHLIETLLGLGQHVVGLDNFSTGTLANLDEALKLAHDEGIRSNSKGGRFDFIEGDITNYETCVMAVQGVDYVLHQAALGSVPRSIESPLNTHQHNTTGTLSMLDAAKHSQVETFVYASSSSVYGDSTTYPQEEDKIGAQLSPYAVSKRCCELYASTYSRLHDVHTMGLRYFNVFGPRQRPLGPYAAVIPKWVNNFLNHEPVIINGDGNISRDFCYVKNIVDANILAATYPRFTTKLRIFNISVGDSTTLNRLSSFIRDKMSQYDPTIRSCIIAHGPERVGDVQKSRAEISRAKSMLGFYPRYDIESGLCEYIDYIFTKIKEK